jgi:hypothetical protein
MDTPPPPLPEQLEPPPPALPEVDYGALGSKSSLLPAPKLIARHSTTMSMEDENQKLLVAVASFSARQDDELTVEVGDEVVGWVSIFFSRFLFFL